MPLDGTPTTSPKAPQLDLPSIYRKTLTFLECRGWYQGGWTSNGHGICLGEALLRAITSELGRSKIARTDSRLNAAATGLGFANLTALVRWNDDGTTTYLAVRSLLQEHS